MKGKEEKNIAAISQELIHLSELKAHINAEFKKSTLTVDQREKLYKEIEKIYKKQKRLQYERRYFRKHNRFPNKRELIKINALKDIHKLKIERKKAIQNLKRWAKRIDDIDDRIRKIEYSTK